jgi:hypothetical protein
MHITINISLRKIFLREIIMKRKSQTIDQPSVSRQLYRLVKRATPGGGVH